MVAAGLVLMFSDTLLSCFSHLFTSPALLFAQLGLSHAFVLFVMGLGVAWVHVWRLSFSFFCNGVPQTGFAALNEVGEKFPSIQTMDINPLVYSILSVNFAFFWELTVFHPQQNYLLVLMALSQMLLVFMISIKPVFFLSALCLVRCSHFLASLCSFLSMSILLTPF